MTAIYTILYHVRCNSSVVLYNTLNIETRTATEYRCRDFPHKVLMSPYPFPRAFPPREPQLEVLTSQGDLNRS